MTTHKDMDVEQHRQIAKDCFNGTWTLLEKPDRTRDEDDTMMHMAHASRYHWGIAGTAVNRGRGEWQISRVYSVLNRPEPAAHHARRCLEICQENSIGDFDLAFAYEALARAAAISGRTEERDAYIQQAREAAQHIADERDRQLLISDLATI